VSKHVDTFFSPLALAAEVASVLVIALLVALTNGVFISLGLQAGRTIKETQERSSDPIVPYCAQLVSYTSIHLLGVIMATAMVSAAFSLVGKALAPLTDGLLKDWAASVKIGDNVEALEQELLAVQALLEHTVGKEIVDNSALKKMLLKLKDLGYDADDVLDELDYFRIQD